MSEITDCVREALWPYREKLGHLFAECESHMVDTIILRLAPQLRAATPQVAKGQEGGK
jgi:hypothetical protein